KNADRAVVGLTGDIIKSLESNNFELSVKKDNVQYQIPAKEFTIDKIAETLGVASNQLEKIEISVIIKEPSNDIQKSIEEQKKSNGVDFVVGAVDFELRAVVMDATGKTKEVVFDRFGQFVERFLEMPKELDPNKITTGIVFNSDGTFEHVPTVVYQEGNRWFTKISSRTNSTYSVVYHPLTVRSVEKHWSKVAVNDMASRMVISETETFKPDEAITRGEFADYIVRALGLFRNECNINNTFNDVSENDIHKISILLAKEYGIIAGYSDGSFKPNEKITREEAMAMFVNALELTELKVNSSVDLSQFADADQISKWAKDDVEKSISTKIFNGRSKEKIEPKGTFTKAEAATAIRNLLIEAKLINDKM
ncbi:MAG: S-layer homology domain-containing protein, partial [Lachnospiraceae bacterium]|nr:S-layer homology domain-containing protein [Lachnospiraceae bacterium]